MNDKPVTILECLVMLKAAYPRQELTDETIAIYEIALKDIKPDLLKLAVLRLLSRSIFFPTIAELRTAATDLTLERRGILTPIQAWNAATNGRSGPLPSMVKQAVQMACGDFYNLRTSTTLAADRARFIEAYTGLVQDERAPVQEIPAVSDYIGAGDAIKQLAQGMKA